MLCRGLDIPKAVNKLGYNGSLVMLGGGTQTLDVAVFPMVSLFYQSVTSFASTDIPVRIGTISAQAWQCLKMSECHETGCSMHDAR